MKMLALSLRMLFRQRRVFSIRLLFLALVLAVTTVSSITLVSSQLKTALINSSSRFIGGDRQLVSPRAVDPAWLEAAQGMGLSWSRSVEFSSMMYANDTLQLVSVKAVDDRYPLKGELVAADKAGARVSVARGPDSGQLWLQGRLYTLFDLEQGDTADIGDLSLTVGRELIQEPDGGFALAGLAPRVMMHFDDVPRTGVVRAGSRLKWKYFFAGSDDALTQYEAFILDQLDNAQRWESIEEGRPAIANALDKTESYLLMGGSLAVLLSCVAIAMASRQFALSQVETVAIMKALGVQGREMVQRFVLQLILLGSAASLVGLLLGGCAAIVLQSLLKALVPELENIQLAFLDWRYTGLSLLTALICLFSFALPQFVQLKHVSPMRVLRAGGHTLMAWSWTSGIFALTGVLGLLYLYSRNIALLSILLAALAGVLVAIALIGWILYRFVAAPFVNALKSDSALRHALSNLVRRRSHSLVQLSVFSFAILLFALIFLARDSLLRDWQSQLPDDAPNHFMINIAPDDLAEIRAGLQQFKLSTSGLYPMVRGRLSHINNVPVKQAVTKDVGALNRELNLTWAQALPEDNKVLEGLWWNDLPSVDQSGGEPPVWVSIESRLAERLEVSVGDRLRFAIGGGEVLAEVSSIRSVQWDSMRPNFYMMFEPGALDGFPATYITSFYLPADQKNVLNTLGKRFPTVSILELDQVVDKVRSIVDQVSAMVEIVMMMILIAALMVMAALIGSDLSERTREAALIRTFGTKRSFIMRAQFFEFAVLGVLSGFVAAICADIVMWQLQSALFEGGFRLHPDIWVWLPLVSGLAGGSICYLMVRKIPSTSPMLILRTG